MDTRFEPGEYVSYRARYGQTELGRVKRDDGGPEVFVVFGSEDSLANYENRTAQSTPRHRLEKEEKND